MHTALEFYQLSSIGDRQTNQDCMAHRVCADYAVFVVADGLGGYEGGEKASQFFCRGLISLAEQFQPQIKVQPQQAINAWITASVAMMRELFADDPVAANAHTTCAVLYLDDDRVIAVHCGDSRIYHLNPAKVLWRSRDHSLIQKLFDDGKISEWEMGVHPEQNRLTRSINVLTPPVVDIRIFAPMQTGETFILCTDGFWESVKEQELLQLSQLGSGKEELKKMAKMTIIRAQGKSDNCTVQWVRKL